MLSEKTRPVGRAAVEVDKHGSPLCLSSFLSVSLLDISRINSGSSSEPALSAMTSFETIGSGAIVLWDNGRRCLLRPFEGGAYTGLSDPGGTMYSVIAKMT